MIATANAEEKDNARLRPLLPLFHRCQVLPELSKVGWSPPLLANANQSHDFHRSGSEDREQQRSRSERLPPIIEISRLFPQGAEQPALRSVAIRLFLSAPFPQKVSFQKSYRLPASQSVRLPGSPGSMQKTWRIRLASGACRQRPQAATLSGADRF